MVCSFLCELFAKVCKVCQTCKLFPIKKEEKFSFWKTFPLTPKSLYPDNQPLTSPKRTTLFHPPLSRNVLLGVTYPLSMFTYLCVFTLPYNQSVHLVQQFGHFEKMYICTKNNKKPEDGNNTESYVDTVSRMSGVSPRRHLTFEDEDEIVAIVAAMALVESRMRAVDTELLHRAYALVAFAVEVVNGKTYKRAHNDEAECGNEYDDAIVLRRSPSVDDVVQRVQPLHLEVRPQNTECRPEAEQHALKLHKLPVPLLRALPQPPCALRAPYVQRIAVSLSPRHASLCRPLRRARHLLRCQIMVHVHSC